MTLPWSTCGLGTAPLGSIEGGPLWFGPQDRDEAVRTVQAAVDAGITWIDTAPFYGWGRAEEIVGDALAGRRGAVRVLTKCGTVRRPDGSWAEDGSPRAVRDDIVASLRRLRTDHVDVLQLHDVDPGTPVETTMGALADLVREGLVGAIGLSNHPANLLDRAQVVAQVAVVQHQYSLLSHDDEAEGAAAWAKAHGARFLAWSPLASGFLTDEFVLDALAPDDLRRRLPWANVPLDDVRAAAARYQMSLQEFALSWAARRAHPIVGARSPDEVGLMARIAPLSSDSFGDPSEGGGGRARI